MRRAPTLVDAGLSAAVALAVLGPVTWSRGYVLEGDMVFVPQMPWKQAWLGLDGQVPRFVPGDALVAAAGELLPGDVVQKLVLLAVFVVGGCGIARLVPGLGGWGRAAAITFFLWNPWVLERLAIGQWGIVVGYALLPGCVLAAERVRDADRSAWPALVAWLGISAAFSPASGLVALVVALAVVGTRPARARSLTTLALGVGVNLPWILPALVISSSPGAPSGQFAAFAARGESGLGVVGSVLSLGGIWKTSVVPGERTDVVVVAASLLLVAVSMGGVLLHGRRHRARVLSLVVTAAGAVALALLTAVPAVAAAADHAARAFPALGLVRDSHRFLGPFALLLALGLAVAVDRVRLLVRPGREALLAVVMLLVAAPVLLLPSLAWGLGGLWRPVSYPDEWSAVRAVLPPGRTVVLPWTGSYRGYDWNARRAVLDPAPRFFPGDVLVDDRLLVGDRTLSSEDVLPDRVRQALASTDPAPGLRRLGVRNVLVEKEDVERLPDLSGARLVHDGKDLRLLDLGRVTEPPPGQPAATRRYVVVAVDAGVLAGWLVAVGLALAALIRRARASPCSVSRTRDTGGRP
jgi:hypothetical protein